MTPLSSHGESSEEGSLGESARSASGRNSSRRFEDWLAAYLTYTEDTEAPTNFHLWTALVTLAGAVQRKVWIDLTHFQWVTNLYVILVGEPGIVTKSTSIRIGRNLLRGVKGFHQGPDSVTWQSLCDAFVESANGFKHEDGQITQSPLTSYVAELGNLLDPKNRELMDFLTDMWDGQAGTFTRRTRSDGAREIVNPWYNFVACTTPTWMRNNFSSDLVGGGFASRVIVVYGEKKNKLIAYPGISGGGLKVEMADDLAADLRHIARMSGEMRLTEEAIKWGEVWYSDAQKSNGKDIITRRASGYFARKQTHLHKIAMLVSLSKRDNLVVELEDLLIANKILFTVEKDMMRVLDNVTNRQFAAGNMLEILEVLKSEKDLTEQQVYKQLYTFMSKEDFDKAVKSLAAADKVYILAKGGRAFLKGKT